MSEVSSTPIPVDPEKGEIPSLDLTKSPAIKDSQAATLSESPRPGSPQHSETTDLDVDMNPGVTYRYLTFATKLPAPNPISNRASDETAPAAPDLRPFQDPTTWHWTRKAVAVGTVAFAGLMVAYSSSAYAFAVPGIMEEFGVSTDVANLGICLFNLAFAFTPMLCAPLSESIGRIPVFMVSGAIFLLGQLVCGVTPTFPGLIIARIMVGCGGSTFSTIVGGVVADIFAAESRNTPMAGFSSTTLIGVGSGLAISGALAQHNDWRWIFYVQTIASAVGVLLVVIFLKETRNNVVLRRKAEALNKWYQQLEDRGFVGVDYECSKRAKVVVILANTHEDSAAIAQQDEKQTEAGHPQQEREQERQQHQRSSTTSSPRYEVVRWRIEADDLRPRMLALIGISVRRPIRMLLTEPVVFFFSMWAMFSWSILYLAFESVPLCFTATYGFGSLQNGKVFLAFVVGVLIVLPLCVAQDRWTRRRPRFSATPEGRLFFVAFISSCTPIGLFWFGWTLHADVHSIVPTVGVGVLGVGIFTVYLAVFNYFADVYGRYASSAMAAQSFCRNFTSSVFPFFSNLLFIRLGFGPAASLLGGIAVLLMVAPILLLLNGSKIRARSSYIEK